MLVYVENEHNVPFFSYAYKRLVWLWSGADDRLVCRVDYCGCVVSIATLILHWETHHSIDIKTVGKCLGVAMLSDGWDLISFFYVGCMGRLFLYIVLEITDSGPVPYKWGEGLNNYRDSWVPTTIYTFYLLKRGLEPYTVRCTRIHVKLLKIKTLLRCPYFHLRVSITL